MGTNGDNNIVAKDLLLEEINAHINAFKQRKNFYRSGTFKFSIFVALISWLTTIAIGANEIFEIQTFSLIALVLSSFSAVTISIDSFYSFKPRWVQTNDTHVSLLELRSKILFDLALNSKIDNDKLKNYHDQLQAILRKANEQWTSQRLSDLTDGK